MSKDRLEEFRAQQQQHDDTVNAAKQGRHLPFPGCVTRVTWFRSVRGKSLPLLACECAQREPKLARKCRTLKMVRRDGWCGSHGSSLTEVPEDIAESLAHFTVSNLEEEDWPAVVQR